MQILTCFTVMFLPVPWNSKRRGLYCSGVTCLKPVATPPLKILTEVKKKKEKTIKSQSITYLQNIQHDFCFVYQPLWFSLAKPFFNYLSCNYYDESYHGGCVGGITIFRVENESYNLALKKTLNMKSRLD